VLEISRAARRVPERTVFTVSELTQSIQELLEERFLLVWVEGEISQLKNHSSGHLFFSLKDQRALLRVIMFREEASRLGFPLREGLKVLCFGRISVYPPRGEYRLIAQRVEPRGLGALQAALEALKEELRRKGYFDPERKRPLPAFPRRVAVVTSLSGAALQDFLRVARSRWAAHILIYPVRVQGEGAVEEIVEALKTLNHLPDLDLIVLTRGGGSLEDLWTFNERAVAEAVYRSRVPVVSAIGHEVDYTICDFVADQRAPTPTAAAALVFPDRTALRERVEALKRRLQENIYRRLTAAEREIHHLRRRLRDPLTLLGERETRVARLRRELGQRILERLAREEVRLRALVRQLEALSPLAVLARGYSVVRKGTGGPVVRRSSEVKPGDLLEILLAEGRIAARVEKTLAPR